MKIHNYEYIEYIKTEIEIHRNAYKIYIKLHIYKHENIRTYRNVYRIFI